MSAPRSGTSLANWFVGRTDSCLRSGDAVKGGLAWELGSHGPLLIVGGETPDDFSP